MTRFEDGIRLVLRATPDAIDNAFNHLSSVVVTAARIMFTTSGAPSDDRLR
jgi:hypothetical protein